MKFIIVYVTAKNVDEGRKIADALLSAKAAACVNIIPGVESHYLWKGALESAKEVLLVIKTRAKNFVKVEKIVKSVHSYEVPEIISVPLHSGERNYLKWLADETKPVLR